MSEAGALRIELSDAPTEQDRQAIGRWIRQVSNQRVGPSGHTRFALLLRQPDHEEVLGGAVVEVLFGWLYVELLGVPDGYRGQRLGSRLLAAVEEQARVRGCNGVWLNCFSFHAADFYLKNGYEQFAALEDFPPGYRNLFFKKQWAVDKSV